MKREDLEGELSCLEVPLVLALVGLLEADFIDETAVDLDEMEEVGNLFVAVPSEEVDAD